MFTKHVSRQLAAHIDGELSPQKADQVAHHLARCADCLAEREQVKYGMDALDQLALVEPPDAIWMSIEAALRQPRAPVRQWRLAFAASAILVLAGAAYWTATHRPGVRWDVVRIDGAPVVNQK